MSSTTDFRLGPPPSSLWKDGVEIPSFEPLARDLSVDTVIVGGGITGLTLAVLLANEGQEVALVERARLGSGTTGHTTAHATVALDVPWTTLAERLGVDRAGLVAKSVRRSIDEIERHARGMDVDCGFRRLPGFRFTEHASELADLDREADVATRLGLDVKRVSSLPIRVPSEGALRFEAQADFHPLRYVAGLARTLADSRVSVFEQSPVSAVEGHAVTVAGSHRIQATHVVDATHTPVGRVPSVQAQLTSQMSYVLVARLVQPIEPGLYWDTADPYHYVRTLPDQPDLVLVGGEDHRTGVEPHPTHRLQHLAAWMRQRFDVRGIEGCWSHELFEPADGLPLIGATLGTTTRFVAAGYSGTGMTFGTVAALLLCDLVLRGTSPWEDVYSPRRVGGARGAAQTVREQAHVGWHFVADRLRKGRGEHLRDLALDSVRVVRIDGQPLAVYRDVSGSLHFRSARCTHMGCIVAWNDLEKTWDCPCHGGRFHRTGKVMYGPPATDLADAAAPPLSDAEPAERRERGEGDPA